MNVFFYIFLHFHVLMGQKWHTWPSEETLVKGLHSLLSFGTTPQILFLSCGALQGRKVSFGIRWHWQSVFCQHFTARVSKSIIQNWLRKYLASAGFGCEFWFLSWYWSSKYWGFQIDKLCFDQRPFSQEVNK